MVQNLIFTILGAFFGALISWYFAKAGKRGQDAMQESLLEAIGKLSAELTEQVRLTLSAVKLLEGGHDPHATEIADKTFATSARAADAVRSLPSELKKKIPHDPHRTGTPCPKCGKPTYPSGMGNDGSGSLVWWYQCPDHGRFPGMDISDLADY